MPVAKKATEPKQTYYYFCLSREVLMNEESAEKRQLLYTDIREVVADEADLHQLSKRFADYIKRGCQPGNDLCTSDLNYYPTLLQAEKRRKELLATFETTGKYHLKQIDLKLG